METTSNGAPLDETIAALDGGLTSLSPSAATSNIDTWIETLSGNDALSGISEGLVELRAALTSGSLDGQKIGSLLTSLGSQTREAGSAADPSAAAGVTRLGGLLETAGKALTSGRS